MKYDVVVVEDDESIGHLLKMHLTDQECRVVLFTEGKKAYQYLMENPCHLVVLDLNLPGMNGLDICKALRSNDNRTPIIMLTAKSDEEDKVSGLDAGADDYLTKPFSIKEFIARVNAILRRSEMDKQRSAQNENLFTYKQLTIDRAKRRVSIHNKPIELTPKEFDLINLLSLHPGVTFERKALLNKVWGYNYEGYEHTVNSHINRLRAKIEEDPDNPKYVLTTWGVGYKFNDE